MAIEGEKLTFRLRGRAAVVAELIHTSLPFWGALKYRKRSEAVYYDSVSDLRQCEQDETLFINERRDILSPMLRSSDARFRLIGLLPLAFFIAQTIHYWRFGGMGNLAWMCNVGNLLLALGLFLNHRELIRAAAIWTIPGLAVWFWYVWLNGSTAWSSTLAHVGGMIVGLWVLRRVRMDRTAWIYAFAWYLFMQVVSRLLTSADLNVNVAHRIQPGWESAFGSFWRFWLVMIVVIAVGLWVIGRVLLLIWPATNGAPASLQTVPAD